MQVATQTWWLEGNGTTRRLVFPRAPGGIHVDLTVEHLEQFARDLAREAERWRAEEKEDGA